MINIYGFFFIKYIKLFLFFFKTNVFNNFIFLYNFSYYKLRLKNLLKIYYFFFKKKLKKQVNQLFVFLKKLYKIVLKKKKKKRKIKFFLCIKLTLNNMFIYIYRVRYDKKYKDNFVLKKFYFFKFREFKFFKTFSLGHVGYKGPTKNGSAAFHDLGYYVAKILKKWRIKKVNIILTMRLNKKIKDFFYGFRKFGVKNLIFNKKLNVFYEKIINYTKFRYIYIIPILAHNGSIIKTKKRI
jgi:hypothetical protein